MYDVKTTMLLTKTRCVQSKPLINKKKSKEEKHTATEETSSQLVEDERLFPPELVLRLFELLNLGPIDSPEPGFPTEIPLIEIPGP